MSATSMAEPEGRSAETRDTNLSVLDVLPLPSTAASIFTSYLFLPGFLTALVTCALFYYRDNPEYYFRIVAYYIVLMILTIFYQASLLRWRVLSLALAGAIVTALLMTEPVINLFFLVFRELPGLVEPATDGFAENFAYHFMAAGLMEELIKAVPALIGLVIGVTLAAFGRARGLIARRIGVLTPMQGLMMGLAAGGAFTLVETLQQYVPRVSAEAAQQVTLTMGEMLKGAPQDAKLQQSLTDVVAYTAAQTGIVSGFYLLMPRVLGALIGHMSYAGIFGYFIGLAGRHRGIWSVPLILLGWVTAATCHATWNAANSASLMMAAGLTSFVLFFTYFLKARPE
jgi:RsiW-degrading membrane proteinase PrsW (M82 family)